MTTLERPQEETRAPITEAPVQRPSRLPLTAILAVLALALGGIVGWIVRGDGAGEPDILLAGDGDISARQEQMLDVVRDRAQAWKDGDVDAVLAGFTPTGTFEAFGNVYRVDDGSLAAYVETGTWTSLEVQEPVLVRGNELFTFHRYGGGNYSELFTFTETGELLITSHVIHTDTPAGDVPAATVADIVLAGEGELTARQEQMVDFMQEYELAWRDGNVGALRAMFTEDGRFTALGTRYRVEDDGFAAFVAGGRGIDVLEPTLVNGSRMMLFHTYGGSTLRDLVRFTTDGELLLVSHEIVN